MTTAIAVKPSLYREALKRVGVNQRDLAAALGLAEADLSRLASGKMPDTPLNTRRKAEVARALMGLALKAGLSDDAVWELNEQQLFGLPGELDRERVMAEVKAKAGEVR